MKGWRFYEEFKTYQRRVPTGNVIAVSTTQEPLTLIHGTTTCAALYDEPNSPVCGSMCSLKYLRRSCKRISEAKAREIHPKLFEYLEMEE